MCGCLSTLFMFPIYLIYYVAISSYYMVSFLWTAIVPVIRVVYNFFKKSVAKENSKKLKYKSNKIFNTDNKDLNANKIIPIKFKFPYIVVKIDKNVTKKIFKNDDINYELFGLEASSLPLTSYYFDNGDYYEFEISEDYNALSGKLINAMFRYLKNKMIVEIGDDEKNIKYRYYYKNGQVIVNNMSPEKQLKFNAKIRNIYNELKTKVTDKCLLDKDENALENELKPYGFELELFYIIDNYLDDDDLIYEWYLSNQVLSIMKKIDLNIQYVPLPDIEVINQVEEPVLEKKTTKSQKQKTSWRDKEFDKEARLWGLSKEDKKIAKEERMSPADYVEALENDDDELDEDK